MPIPTFTELPPYPEFKDLVNKINTLVSELTNLILNLDSLNVVSLTADHIDAGTLDAGVVTVRTDLNAGGYIKIDSTGMTVNNGTKNTLRIDLNGNVTAEDGTWTAGSITGSTITGGTVRTATSNNQRIELSSGSFKGYTADNLLSGLVFDPNKTSDIVDLFLYHRGSKLAEIYDNITGYKIRGSSGAAGFWLGGNGVTTYGEGTWEFNSSSSVDTQGTFKVKTGTAFDTILQSNSTATTVADLVTDFNTLLSNLRSMNILA